MEQTATQLELRLDNAKESKLFKRVFMLSALGMIIDASDVYMAGAVNTAMINSKFSTLAESSNFISAGFLGLFIGSLFAGYLGDKFGRRTAYQINLLIFGIATILGAFAPNIMVLSILRFIAACGLGSEIITGYAIVNEFAPTKTRGRWSGATAIIANFGAPLALALSLFIIPHYSWRAMFLVVGFLAIILWLARRHFPESPRWLLSKGRTKEAQAIIEQLETAGSYAQENNASTKETITISYPRALFISIITVTAILVSLFMFTSWVPTMLLQRGINVAHSLKYTMLMMIGAPIGALIGTILIEKIGRRITIITTFIIGAILAIIYTIITAASGTIAIGFLLTTCFYILMAAAVGVYTPEIFQTPHRFRGMGWAHGTAKFLTILTPYFAAYAIGKTNPAMIFYVITGLFLIAALTIAFAGPETRFKNIK
ncbi:MFS transporter [Fructilactobacillus frigidiflavus]|uniref:MFS transporter n=1 Tax=Fructilactobacillus frigidiflavus TaxID=3242688 RepID=UPI0037567AD3